jgi:hypothetical protein
MLKAGSTLRKTKGQTGFHGKLRSPGKQSHTVRLLHLGQNAKDSISSWGRTTVQDSSLNYYIIMSCGVSSSL